jgi:hypothetical protein
MRPADKELYDGLDVKLTEFIAIRQLPGINTDEKKDCLIKQIIDSVRRIKYVTVIRDKNYHDDICANPESEAFDPIKAAAWHHQQQNIDEAFWLAFLSTHFGRNHRTRWKLVKDIYKGPSNAAYWTWARVKQNPDAFRGWLDMNQETLRNGKFGNHRKYQSLGAYNNNGTGHAIASYVEWIGENQNHQNLIDRSIAIAGNNPKELFRHFYNSMDGVASFGRMAKFDYLTMVGKLGLVNIEPDSTYMNGATGPFSGARLLFGQNANAATLDEWLFELDSHLNLPFGMQVLEDAICNWQKSQNEYKYFGG